MGQSDVLEFLEKQWNNNKKKYLSEKEIEKGTNIRECGVVLRKLKQQNAVEYKQIPNKNNTAYYLYRHKSDAPELAIEILDR